MELLFVLSGLAAGVFSGAMGVGGAIVATPLIRFLGVAPHLAIGTTVPSLLPTTITGAWTYLRAGLVDKRAALWIAVSGAAAAVAGAFTTRLVDGHVLMLVTAVLLMGLSLRLLRQADKSPDDPRPRNTPLSLMVLGVASGFASGLLGVGGGFIIVPALVRFFGFPLKTALGTSLAVITLTVIPNAAAQSVAGNVDWKVAALLSLGVVPGARAGSLLAIRASDRGLRVTVGVVLTLVALAYGVMEVLALRG